MDFSTQLICPDIVNTQRRNRLDVQSAHSCRAGMVRNNVESEPWQWLGASLVVEHRFAAGLIEGITDAGLGIG